MSQRITLKFKSGPIAGQSFSIGPGEFSFIGSAESCSIRIVDDPTISPTHACIFHDPSGAVRFKDMGSQFGTFRNGKLIKTTVDLKPGDRITIGQTTTFQNSWWNALQATKLTKFSRFKGAMGPETNSGRWFHKTGGRLGLVFGTLMLGIAIMVFGQQDLVPAVGEKANVQAGRNAEKTRRAQDLGIFSGSLSAKLFGTKPKRAAKASVEMSAESLFIWDEIVAISRRFGDPPPSAMDPGFVKEVERHLRRFTKGGYHKAMLARRDQFWPVIERGLAAKGLPVELGYIVWVESNFQLDVASPVGAMGPWQFMPETAKEYGLKVGGPHDERMDLAKSTQAAAEYFEGLLKMFGTERYLLAIASYNAGQYRVKRYQIASTVNKEKVVDFWHLRFLLPTETAEYVPKFLAAIIIGRNPERWDVGH
jgi:soluble lytic murein transglycosylase-like protein